MKNSNGTMFLKIWRGALASVMVAALIGAWTASGEIAAQKAILAQVVLSLDKIDDRLRSLETVGWRSGP